MISTHAESVNTFDIFMAKDKNSPFPWMQIGLWIIGGLVGIIGILLGVVYDNFDRKLFSIDNTLSSINLTLRTHGELLARLDERTKSLERSVEKLEKPHWESKARAAGLKAPQIIPTSLQSQSKFESKVEVGAQKVAIHYTIIKYDPVDEVMTLRVDEVVPGYVIRNNIFTLSAKQGESVQLPHIFPNFPKVFMRVIDRPSPDRAILAIGEKVDRGGNSS